MHHRIATLIETISPQAAAAGAALRAARFELHLCADAFELFSALQGQVVDACVLAIEPQPKGTEVLTYMADTLAAMTDLGVSFTPVFVVGPQCPESMQAALSGGATDYLVHTQCADKLAGRVDAHLRARTRSVQRNLRVGNCELVWALSSVRTAGLDVLLTPHEFALAAVLFAHVGQAVPTEAFAMRIWGRSGDLCRRTLEQHLYRLRRKLQHTPLRIRTVYGSGYRLDAAVPTERRSRVKPRETQRTD